MRRRSGPRRVALPAARLGLALAWALSAAPGWAGAAPATDEAVTAVARQLRCVVCQNLSIADSPSEMARQMREVIRERLGRGETPAGVRAYFVDKYGEWVLLAPPARGFNLLLWTLPFAGLLGGLALVFVSARRWTRRPTTGEPPAAPALGPAERERVLAELDRLRD